jgi:hypothetical protein
MSVVSVVAGGFSVKGDHWNLDFLPGYVIAVNDSALYLPRVDCIVSMDRLWTEHRWEWLCSRRCETHIRVSALKNVFSKENWLHVFECDYQRYEFSTEPRVLNGTNSGECALNQAYKIMPQKVLLFGFDYCPGPNGEQHWFPDYPWKSGKSTKIAKLKEWSGHYRAISRQFKDAGVEVINMSSRSLIKDFDMCDRSEMVIWQ